LSRELAVDRFRYFVVENSTVLALLEEPLGNDQGSSHRFLYECYRVWMNVAPYIETMIQGSIPNRGKRSFSSSQRPD
jgi:hypothetical protein